MSSRCCGVLAGWLLLVGLCRGGEPQVLPGPPLSPHATAEQCRQVSAVEHLQLAADQLETAGLAEQAANLRLIGKQFSEDALQSIRDLEQEAALLRRKSQRLQQLIGRPNEVTCVCRFLELSAKAAAELKADAGLVDRSTESGKSAVPSAAAGKNGVSVCKNGEAVLERMRAAGKVTILMESRIVVTPGQAAAATTGGELPILVATAGERPAVDYRRFGLRCDVNLQFLDSGKCNLDVTPEIVERDYSHAVEVNGETIPGLSTRRVRARSEVNLGDMLVVCFGTPQDYETEELASPAALQAALHLFGEQLVGAQKCCGTHGSNTVTFVTVTPLAQDLSSH
jgi:Flp pilus assembly secretin CpaC